MTLLPFFKYFDTSWWGLLIRDSSYAFPAIECFHLFGMVCLLGTLLMIDLRLLGLGMRSQPVKQLASALAPVTWIGLATMIVTGVLLFSSEPMKCYRNTAFPHKMAFLFCGLIVYVTVHRSVTKMDEARIGPIKGKLVGCLSLALWFSVALAGRAIAYV